MERRLLAEYREIRALMLKRLPQIEIGLICGRHDVLR